VTVFDPRFGEMPAARTENFALKVMWWVSVPRRRWPVGLAMYGLDDPFYLMFGEDSQTALPTDSVWFGTAEVLA
jgi:hypothetical protein